jgi:hypothetical protein
LDDLTRHVSVLSKPAGEEGAQARKRSIDNSRVVEISAYSSRAQHQYRDQCFADLIELSSHDRRERGIQIERSCGYRKYFCSCFRRQFVGMAIDNRLMLISEVATIAATRDRKGIFVDSETR